MFRAAHNFNYFHRKNFLFATFESRPGFSLNNDERQKSLLSIPRFEAELFFGGTALVQRTEVNVNLIFSLTFDELRLEKSKRKMGKNINLLFEIE